MPFSFGLETHHLRMRQNISKLFKENIDPLKVISVMRRLLCSGESCFESLISICHTNRST